MEGVKNHLLNNDEVFVISAIPYCIEGVECTGSSMLVAKFSQVDVQPFFHIFVFT